MAKTEELNKAIQNLEHPKSIQQLIEKSAKELGKALPEHMRPERLVRIALTCIRLNPDLASATSESFLGALFTSAQLGVEPVAGQAYLIPFNNKRKINGQWKSFKEVQFVLGYKGLASLFYRHEKAVQLDWGVVHVNDTFSYEYGTNAFLKHIPAGKDRGEVKAFYVVATLQGGGKPFMVMSRDECMDHGKAHSKTYDQESKTFYPSSPWSKTPDAMCLKTVLIQLGKLLPLSIELQKAITADETTREYRSGVEDALDIPTNTTWDDGEVPADAKPVAQPAPPAAASPAAPAPAPASASKVITQEVMDHLTDVMNEMEWGSGERGPFLAEAVAKGPEWAVNEINKRYEAWSNAQLATAADRHELPLEASTGELPY